MLDTHALAKPKIDELQTRGSVLIENAKALVITSQADMETGADLAKAIGSLAKRVEQARTAITGPLNDGLKAANSMFKKVADPLKDAAGDVRDKMLTYTLKQEQAAREEAAAARKAAEDKALEEAATLEALGYGGAANEAVEQQIAATEAPVQVERTITRGGMTGAAAFTKKVWTFELEDFNAVPDAYKSLNEVQVRKAIAAGARTIAGLHIFQKDEIAVR
jgi:hypothetical protein